jgi:putative ABC transport system permease protein
MRLIDLLKLTWTNLTRTRFRAALSAFGVVIGTGAIVVLFSLAAGLQKLAADNLGGLGPLNEINIFSLGGDGGAGGGGGGFSVVIIGVTKSASSKLKPDYLDSLAEQPGIKAVTPVVNFNGQATLHDDQYQAQPNIKGVNPDAPANFNYAMSSGTAELGRWQVLVGAKVGDAFSDPSIRSGDNRVPRLDLQGKSLTLELTRKDENGQTVRRVLRLQVAGVLAPRGYDYDYSLIMRLSDVDELNTWTSGQQVNHQRTGYPGATVLAADSKSQNTLVDQIQKDGFFATSPNQVLEQVNRTYYALQAFVGGVGLITLLIAGTGIANTLITAIYERTAEIGLMKAVGATTRQVMAVFLAEAAAIGGGGGLVGLVLGMLLSQAINAVASQSVAQQLSGPAGSSGPVNIVATPLWLLVLAPLFAMGIGIIAGLYPARRAAHLDPVAALRYE